MRLETLLPLGKVDPGLRAPDTGLDLGAVATDARLLEELGYYGAVIEETKQDPYVVMALAAEATTRLEVGTGIAMAFPRSPTITALSAWTLQKLSRGRFTLGLGPQVRAHIERRYGMPWSLPAPGCASTSGRSGQSGGAGRTRCRWISRARITRST